jgi:hypothetical protein
MAELGLAGRVYQCGEFVRVVSARRRHRRRQGIISLDLSFTPTTFFFGAYSEVGEFCPGVRGRGFIVFAR